MSNLTEYLNFIWGDVNGYGCVAILDKDKNIKRVFPKWPEQKETTAEFIQTKNAQGYETYVTPAMWDSKITDGDYRNHFLQSRVLWADMDGNAPSDWPPAATSGAGTADVPEPSLRLQTSIETRQHMYWLLDKPITDVQQFDNVNRTLSIKLNADPGGWDAPQLLRPPDTNNHGYSKPERKGKKYPVFIEENSNKIYSLDKFEVINDFRPLVKDSLGEIPPVTEVLAKYAWPKDFGSLFSDMPPEGERSDHLQAVAYVGAEHGATNEEIYSLIFDCDERWGKYKHRGDRHIRLSDIVERAKSKHPIALNELNFDTFINSVTPAETNSDDSTTLQTLYTYDEFVKVKINIDWIFEGLLYSQGYGMIAGPTGLGKSQLAIRFAEKALKNESWLGWKNVCTKKLKVMLLSLEMDTLELQQFFNVMAGDGSFMKDVEDRFFIMPLGEDLPLDTPDGQKFIEQKLDQVRPDILIIDSLSKSMQGDFKDDNASKYYNKVLNAIRKKYGLAIVTIHHNRKSQDKKYLNNEIDDLYGSRFLPQDASFVLMGTKDKTDITNILLSEAKIRFAQDGGIRVVTRTEHLDFYVEGITDTNDIPKLGGGGSGGQPAGFFS